MLCRCALWLTLFSLRVLATTSEPDELSQGFFFDYIPQEQTWVIPTTERCQSIHLKWDRGAATGPNPVAPYTLQVYTSAFITPFLVNVESGPTYDWPVPFYNGTVYQVCMFASNGVTGGCQDLYTVIPSSIDSCNNVTFPDAAMDVKSDVSATKTQVGADLGQFAWVEQCSDILIKPNEGQAPFTLTIAPSLAPPINITSDNTDTISWAVTLGRSASFFMSLASADGKVWSYGPLHVSPGDTSCMSSSATSGSMISSAKAAGASVGSLIAGLIIGALFMALFGVLQRRRDAQRNDPAARVDGFRGTGSANNLAYDNPEVVQYPKPETSNASATALSPMRYGESSNTPARSPSDSSSGPFVTETTTVVRRHHDGGFRYPPPSEERDVVELPPEYMSDSGAATESGSGRANRLRGGSVMSSFDEEEETSPATTIGHGYNHRTSRSEKGRRAT